MREREKTRVITPLEVGGVITTEKLRAFARENHIKVSNLEKRIGNPKLLHRIFWEKEKPVAPVMRKCPICRKHFYTHGRKSPMCDDDRCQKIYHLKLRNEQIELDKFKFAIVKALLEEAQISKMERAKKARERWESKTPEERAELTKKRVESARIRRESRKKELKNDWNEESLNRARLKRIKKMQQNKIMKAALLEILNGNDESSGINNLKVMSEAIVNRVKETGDPRAATFIRDTIDEDPKRDVIDISAKIVFAPPTELRERLGDDIVDAEYREVDEREQYEKLRAKFDSPVLEDKTKEDLTQEIKDTL